MTIDKDELEKHVNSMYNVLNKLFENREENVKHTLIINILIFTIIKIIKEKVKNDQIALMILCLNKTLTENLLNIDRDYFEDD